jgi:heme exporter protein B
MVSRILALVRFEALMEFRNKALTGSLFVYVISTVFVCYRAFESVDSPAVWNALFWLVVLFSCTNAVLRSFQRENKGNALYLYQTLKPGELILAKITFNYILTLLLVVGTLPVFFLLLGSPLKSPFVFLLVVFLAAGAVSACLTLVSALAAKTTHAAGLTPVLGFPVILPLLMVAVKASGNAAAGMSLSMYWDLPLVLGAFNLILVVLSYLLFPYLWRD